MTYPDGTEVKVSDRVVYGRDQKFQVRAFVDGRAVLRQWWPSKGRWYYVVVEDFEFEQGHYRRPEPTPTS